MNEMKGHNRLSANRTAISVIEEKGEGFENGKNLRQRLQADKPSTFATLTSHRKTYDSLVL